MTVQETRLSIHDRLKQFKQRIKDLLLPYENPDHPLYFDKAAIEQEEQEMSDLLEQHLAMEAASRIRER